MVQKDVTSAVAVGAFAGVDIDLTPFSWINPCGLCSVSMTSLSRDRKANRGSRVILVQALANAAWNT